MRRKAPALDQASQRAFDLVRKQGWGVEVLIGGLPVEEPWLKGRYSRVGRGQHYHKAGVDDDRHDLQRSPPLKLCAARPNQFDYIRGRLLGEPLSKRRSSPENLAKRRAGR